MVSTGHQNLLKGRMAKRDFVRNVKNFEKKSQSVKSPGNRISKIRKGINPVSRTPVYHEMIPSLGNVPKKDELSELKNRKLEIIEV